MGPGQENQTGIDPTLVERDWRSRGFSCGQWVDPPGQAWEDYVHAADELLMVLEGELELEMQGRTIRPGIGEEVLIPAAKSFVTAVDLVRRRMLVRGIDDLVEDRHAL